MIFNINNTIRNKYTLIRYLVFILILQSCATYEAQFGKNITQPISKQERADSISHRFFLIGDAGNADEEIPRNLLEVFSHRTKASDKNATLVFLGDNIYDKGMPADKDHKERKPAEEKLTYQLKIAKDFKGKTVFIPGNHDWYSGIKGLQEQEEFVTKYLGDKKSFLPRNSCGIERMNINNKTVLIAIDSQWFLENWDKSPTINDDCDIKTREAFFDELKSELNKHQDKTILLAIHHPLLSNSSHGGQVQSARKQLYPTGSIPLPVLGSVINFFRPVIGIPQDIQSAPYRELSNRIQTLIADSENVIVISGHEHNIQYIEYQNIKQIISGAGSKTDEARAVYPNDFSYGKPGYVLLDILKNGSSVVYFYGFIDGKEQLLFSKEVLPPQTKETESLYPDKFPETIVASIYTHEGKERGKVYNFLFGEKYRKYYNLKVEVPVLSLDTVFGGLKPLRSGGGMQSNSLRLADKNGKEYAMRSLKKNTTRFIQTLYTEQYVEDDFEDTGASAFLYDFYTSSNQYYPFIVQYLSKPLNINYTMPKLYYVPKQNNLGKYNNSFGDELYMLEERPMSENSSAGNFGNADDIISTPDLLLKLLKNEKAGIDEPAYIRARLFDMLLGDWDRHSDQWRWAEHKQQDGNKIYRPIPRDRDQVFAKYDGILLSYLLKIPALRHITHFDEDPNLKWLNKSAYILDLALVTRADENSWIEQARFIQENLTDEAIENAFAQLPKELQDETTQNIISVLKIRRAKLVDWAKERYNRLQKKVLITGTDKKDRFEINRLENGKTEVKTYRIKKDKEELISEKTYSADLTKEIWIYGLDDNDIFEVNGESEKYIKIRLIGGQNNDTFRIANGKNVFIYDYKSKKNTIEADNKTRIRLTDQYDINTYDYKKPKYNISFLYPNIGFNPDDGVKIGANYSYEVNNFKRNPYSQKHSLSAMYYFATHGIELGYQGIFANVLGKWNLALDAGFTTPNFTVNYFGFGNETSNYDNDFGMDYNRVRMQTLRFSTSLFRTGKYGSRIDVKLGFDNIKTDDTQGRFVSVSPELDADVFHTKYFAVSTVSYVYNNYNYKAFPTKGFTFSALASWTVNLEETERNFPYLETSLGFIHKITKEGNLTFATLFKGQFLLNNDFEFYQGAALGGNNGLRGFRNERFLGKTAYYQSSDIRLLLGSIKSFIPMKYGVSGGYDYGRVWLSGEDSNQWHQSYGGGIWINAAELTALNLNLFHSKDGLRFTFGLGLDF